MIVTISRDSSKEALLEHVREHAKLDNGHEDPKNFNSKKPETTLDPADLAYRCGHCNQLSNWKHVIQVVIINRETLIRIMNLL